MEKPNKTAIANTIIDMHDGYKGGNECFKYGSVWGCDTGCPVLNAGKCELKDSECADLWEQVKTEQN